MPDLQHAIREIEQRAADFFAVPENPGSGSDRLLPEMPDTQTLAEEPTCASAPEPIVLPSSERHEKTTSPLHSENPDPLFLAGQKVLRQLETPSEATLLLLSESSLSLQVPGGDWGRIFAELTMDPVLAVGLFQYVEHRQSSGHAEDWADAKETIPSITQSDYPGLCTLSTACSALRGRRADRWWKEARSHFGMILLDGSGLDLLTVESILPKCSHALFAVEYGSTSRDWAAQMGKVIAARKINSVGCIASARHAAA
jgi:hypothetical protein